MFGTFRNLNNPPYTMASIAMCLISRVIPMNEIATQILSVLRAAGSSGLLIDELIDKIGVDADTITETLDKLSTEGLIMQKQELKNEQPTIRAHIGNEPDGSSMTDLNGCPCFHCLRIGRCGLRQPDSPADCRELESWMGSS